MDSGNTDAHAEGDKTETKFRSRKFIVTAFAILTATAFLPFGFITGDNWTEITLVCVGAYNLGNALASRSK